MWREKKRMMLMRWPERGTDRLLKEVTGRDGVLLPHGFQGLPLPGGAVARQDYNDGEIIMRALIKWLIISWSPLSQCKLSIDPS